MWQNPSSMSGAPASGLWKTNLAQISRSLPRPAPPPHPTLSPFSRKFSKFSKKLRWGDPGLENCYNGWWHSRALYASVSWTQAGEAELKLHRLALAPYTRENPLVEAWLFPSQDLGWASADDIDHAYPRSSSLFGGGAWGIVIVASIMVQLCLICHFVANLCVAVSPIILRALWQGAGIYKNRIANNWSIFKSKLCFCRVLVYSRMPAYSPLHGHTSPKSTTASRQLQSDSKPFSLKSFRHLDPSHCILAQLVSDWCKELLWLYLLLLSKELTRGSTAA